MTLNTEKQGNIEAAEALPTPHELETEGSVVLATTTVQSWTGNLISMAVVPACKLRDLNLRGDSQN